jgi:hypothetical protein
MDTLVVLFKLRPDADVAAYEAWAKSTDLPVVRKLPSVSSFEIYRSQGLFGSDEAAPYDYVEIIDISDLQGFGKDVATDTMTKVAGEFRGFADNPVFILTKRFS